MTKPGQKPKATPTPAPAPPPPIVQTPAKPESAVEVNPLERVKRTKDEKNAHFPTNSLSDSSSDSSSDDSSDESSGNETMQKLNWG